jgi:hypothetical protein
MAVKTGALKPTVDVKTPANGRAGRAATLGVLGLLVAALVALAAAPWALPASYSSAKHGLSEAAAQGVDGAWVARTGFILFGLVVVWLVQLRATVWSVRG